MTLRVGLTHPVLAQLRLTWMDYLLTMLRNRLRRKRSYDISILYLESPYLWFGSRIILFRSSRIVNSDHFRSESKECRQSSIRAKERGSDRVRGPCGSCLYASPADSAWRGSGLGSRV